jgi:hypothetical protein
MSSVASLEKWSLRSIICVAGGKFPTQSAWPDCLGFLGGPLSADVCRDEFELLLLTAVRVTNVSHWGSLRERSGSIPWGFSCG